MLFRSRVVSSAYLRLLIFLLAILIPACASSSPAFLMMYSAYKLNKQGDNIHHQMVNTEIRLIIFFATKDGEALSSEQKQDWDLSGSVHELFIAKFRLKLKKVGKITRPFRYEIDLRA